MLNLRKIYKRKIGIFGNGNTGKKTKEALSLTYNKILIYDDKIKKLNKIESNKKIYKILDEELKMFIHSIQILIS